MSSRLFYEHTIASLASRHDFDRDAYYEEISVVDDGAGSGRTSPNGRCSPKRASFAADDRTVASSKSSDGFRRSQRRIAAQDDKSYATAPSSPTGRAEVERCDSPRQRKTPSPRPTSLLKRRPGSPQRPISPFKPVTPKSSTLISVKQSPASSIANPHQKTVSSFRPSSPSKLSYPSMDDSPPIRLYNNESAQSPKRQTQLLNSRESPSKVRNKSWKNSKSKFGSDKPCVSSVKTAATPPSASTAQDSFLNDDLDDLLGDGNELQTTELVASLTSPPPPSVAPTRTAERGTSTLQADNIEVADAGSERSPTAPFELRESLAVEIGENTKTAAPAQESACKNNSMPSEDAEFENNTSPPKDEMESSPPVDDKLISGSQEIIELGFSNEEALHQSNATLSVNGNEEIVQKVDPPSPQNGSRPSPRDDDEQTFEASNTDQNMATPTLRESESPHDAQQDMIATAAGEAEEVSDVPKKEAVVNFVTGGSEGERGTTSVGPSPSSSEHASSGDSAAPAVSSITGSPVSTFNPEHIVGPDEGGKVAATLNQNAKQVAIREPVSRTNSLASTPQSETDSTAHGSDEQNQNSRKNISRKGILQSIMKSERNASKTNPRSKKKKSITKPVFISCKFNPSQGFSDFYVKKHKKVYKGVVDYEKGKLTAESLSRIIIEELFERDFWPGKHWEIGSARVSECSGSKHPAFNAEKVATWDWKDIYSKASATAVIHFHPDRILIENYAYHVAG
ncbi:hypothetical protein ACA910_017523 [Epithemia clementina (nom. ined.)]